MSMLGRCLKLQGRMSTRAVSEHPKWVDFLPELFLRLTSLERFEASMNAHDLVQAIEHILEYSPDPDDVLVVSKNVMCRFKGLWVALDQESRAFRGAFRSLAAARSASGPLLASTGFVLLV